MCKAEHALLCTAHVIDVYIVCLCFKSCLIRDGQLAMSVMTGCMQGSVMWRARIGWQEGMEDPVTG